MKNFQDLLIQNQKIDASPFIFATPQVQNQMQLGVFGKISNLILGTTLAHIITAPLQTIVTSMQLSVLPHKDLFVSVESRTKELAKLNTQLTVAEKRNLQLMIRTGGQFQPYTAPVYTGYQQAAKNLAKQGWQAFFKGLSLRLMHTIPHFLCYGSFFKYLFQKDYKKFEFTTFIAKCYGLMAVTDATLNMFHVMQNRYILQNNIKQFRVFRNVLKVLSKIITRGELFKGISYHAFNGLVQIALKFPVFIILLSTQKITGTTMGLYYLSEVILYPFNTAYKRFLCQSTVIPGMIPIRYSSWTHAVKVITFEQKMRGLYRGFGLHSVSILGRLMILQLVMQHVDIKQKGEF